MHVPVARRARRQRFSRHPGARLTLAVGILATTLASPLASPPPAVGQPNCISNIGAWFSGMWTAGRLDHNSSHWIGASALLVPRHGHICDFNPNFNDPQVRRSDANTTSGWSMVQQSGPTCCGYAQTGYYRGWGESTYFFFEYARKRDPAGTFTRSVEYARGPLTMGGINRYWVQFVDGGPEGSRFRLNIDSTVIGETPFAPFGPNGIWDGQNPLSASFAGETHYQGTDMPGTQAVPALFQGIELQLGNRSWTTSMPQFFGAGPGGPRYGFARDTLRSFKVWTFGV